MPSKRNNRKQHNKLKATGGNLEKFGFAGKSGNAVSVSENPLNPASGAKRAAFLKNVRTAESTSCVVRFQEQKTQGVAAASKEADATEDGMNLEEPLSLSLDYACALELGGRLIRITLTSVEGIETLATWVAQMRSSGVVAAAAAIEEIFENLRFKVELEVNDCKRDLTHTANNLGLYWILYQCYLSTAGLREELASLRKGGYRNNQHWVKLADYLGKVAQAAPGTALGKLARGAANFAIDFPTSCHGALREELGGTQDLFLAPESIIRTRLAVFRHNADWERARLVAGSVGADRFEEFGNNDLSWGCLVALLNYPALEFDGDRVDMLWEAATLCEVETLGGYVKDGLVSFLFPGPPGTTNEATNEDGMDSEAESSATGEEVASVMASSVRPVTGVEKVLSLSLPPFLVATHLVVGNVSLASMANPQLLMDEIRLGLTNILPRVALGVTADGIRDALELGPLLGFNGHGVLLILLATPVPTGFGQTNFTSISIQRGRTSVKYGLLLVGEAEARVVRMGVSVAVVRGCAPLGTSGEMVRRTAQQELSKKIGVNTVLVPANVWHTSAGGELVFIVVSASSDRLSAEAVRGLSLRVGVSPGCAAELQEDGWISYELYGALHDIKDRSLLMKGHRHIVGGFNRTVVRLAHLASTLTVEDLCSKIVPKIAPMECIQPALVERVFFLLPEACWYVVLVGGASLFNECYTLSLTEDLRAGGSRSLPQATVIHQQPGWTKRVSVSTTSDSLKKNVASQMYHTQDGKGDPHHGAARSHSHGVKQSSDRSPQQPGSSKVTLMSSQSSSSSLSQSTYPSYASTVRGQDNSLVPLDMQSQLRSLMRSEINEMLVPMDARLRQVDHLVNRMERLETATAAQESGIQELVRLFKESTAASRPPFPGSQPNPNV